MELEDNLYDTIEKSVYTSGGELYNLYGAATICAKVCDDFALKFAEWFVEYRIDEILDSMRQGIHKNPPKPTPELLEKFKKEVYNDT